MSEQIADNITKMNDSYYEYEYEAVYDHTDNPTFAPTVTIYSITFLTGVVGNSLVVCAMLGDRKSRSVTSAFLVSLAIADMMFLLVCVPYEIGHRFTGYWAGGKGLCLFAAFIKVMCGIASVLNLVALSVERFIVIVLPLRSRQLCTPGTSKKILVGVWIASILLGLPVFHFQSHKVTYYGERNGTAITAAQCWREHDVNRYFSIYQMCVIFIIPSVVMTGCYAMVIRVLWLSTKQLSKLTAPTRKSNQMNGSKNSGVRHPLTSSDSDHGNAGETVARSNSGSQDDKDHSSDMKEARKQVIKMLIAIVLVFLICWGPAVLVEAIHSFSMIGPIDYNAMEILIHAKLACNLLPFVQSCLNPIIYTFMSSTFRRSLKTMFMKCAMRLRCCEKKIPEYEMECKSGFTLSTHSRVNTVTRVSAAPTSSS